MKTASQKESIVQEFLDNANKYTSHVRPYHSEQDMILCAQENCKRTEEYAVLLQYIEELHNYYCTGSTQLIIYMPEMYGHQKFRGKIIIESTSSSQMFFEIQLSKKTDFTQIRKVDLASDFEDGDPWHKELRFHNIFLAKDQAIPFVQELLFGDRFRQRSLITIAPKVMGVITTQQLRSACGQALSFRQCVLKE